MKAILVLLAFSLALVFVKPAATISEAETLYEQRKFSELRKALKELSSSKSSLGAINRLEGHLCFFGEDRDKNVDVACAWQKYSEAAHHGDPEGRFYTALFLDNLLFDSLDPLKGQFDSEIAFIESAPDLSTKFRSLNAMASTMYYLSAVSGFPPAMQILGRRENIVPSKCSTASTYYSKAAHKLLPHFNQSFQNSYVRFNTILSTTDPFATSNNLLEHVAGLRMYEQMAEGLEDAKERDVLIGKIAENYLIRQEYELAKSAAENALETDPNNTNANYVLGVINMAGVLGPKNYSLAIDQLTIAGNKKHADALNALGFMHLNGFGMPQDETLAYGYFKKAFDAGSSSGGYNLASRLLSENRLSQTESLHRFLVSSDESNVHGLYNLGIMFMYGLGVSTSCPNALHYLKAATEAMVWQKYFGNAYDLYLKSEKKVAALKYMVMAEVGSAIAQLNAGNLFDAVDVVTGKLWIHDHDPSVNINKRLALKNYLAAASQGDEHANIRLGDYYYYGYEVEKDLDIALGYYHRASYKVTSASLIAYAWFDYGYLLHYGVGVPKDYEKASYAYNVTMVTHSASFYPAKIMNVLLDISEYGLGKVLPKVQKAALGFSIVFVLAVMFLILKRN